MAGKRISRVTYEGQNLMAAKIIAANPAKYPGLPTIWAAIILSKGATNGKDQTVGRRFNDAA